MLFTFSTLHLSFPLIIIFFFQLTLTLNTDIFFYALITKSGSMVAVLQVGMIVAMV